MMRDQKEVYLGADHAGFALKEKLKELLLEKGYKVHDVGARFYQKNDDYPVFAARLGKEVAQRRGKGILICGSAEGVCIAANKLRGVRAIAAFTPRIARLSREHNDANVLCLSGWFLKEKEVKKIVDVWLKTRFSKISRHVRRIQQIALLEGD